MLCHRVQISLPCPAIECSYRCHAAMECSYRCHALLLRADIEISLLRSSMACSYRCHALLWSAAIAAMLCYGVQLSLPCSAIEGRYRDIATTLFHGVQLSLPCSAMECSYRCYALLWSSAIAHKMREPRAISSGGAQRQPMQKLSQPMRSSRRPPAHAAARRRSSSRAK